MCWYHDAYVASKKYTIRVHLSWILPSLHDTIEMDIWLSFSWFFLRGTHHLLPELFEAVDDDEESIQTKVGQQGRDHIASHTGGSYSDPTERVSCKCRSGVTRWSSIWDWVLQYYNQLFRSNQTTLRYNGRMWRTFSTRKSMKSLDIHILYSCDIPLPLTFTQ